MSRPARMILVLAAAAALGACARSPLDLIAPADMALLRSEATASSTDPISIESLLSQARGSSPVQQQATAPIDQQHADASESATISLEDLRQQVLGRDTPAKSETVCR